MRLFKITSVFILLAAVLTSCSSVRVASDYDQQANFAQYRSFAFFKPGIDQAEISDLDKRRILRAIESEMVARGFTKTSEDPDLLISIFTQTKENINVYQNNMMGWGWGMGWHPWMWGGMGPTTVGTSSDGTLYIDFIDAERKELVWQGMGTATLATKVEKKQGRINQIVRKMLDKYPPKIR